MLKLGPDLWCENGMIQILQCSMTHLVPFDCSSGKMPSLCPHWFSWDAYKFQGNAWKPNCPKFLLQGVELNKHITLSWDNDYCIFQSFVGFVCVCVCVCVRGGGEYLSSILLADFNYIIQFNFCKWKWDHTIYTEMVVHFGTINVDVFFIVKHTIT